MTKNSISTSVNTQETKEYGLVNLEEIDFDELDDYLELFQQDLVAKEALSRGVDLRQYAQQIETDLRQAEMDSVSQYVMKASDIVDLHDQVQNCDNILAKMQEMLLGFQADLGGISDEIRTLQQESISMNVRLKNRRETEDILKIYLDQIALSPSLISTINDGEIDEAYLHALVTLNGKLKYLSISQKTVPILSEGIDILPSQTKAYEDVITPLEKLKTRASVRLREYLFHKVMDVKKPKTNIQMLQQNILLPIKYSITFLRDNTPDFEMEFRELYAESMSKSLVHVFKSYHTGLMKFHDEVATKYDLLAIEEQSLKSMFTSRVNFSKQTDTFAMGDRDKILQLGNSPPISLHIAQEDHMKLPYEAIFRHEQQHLMNAATSEFVFLIDFFYNQMNQDDMTEKHQVGMQVRDLFLRIFAKTISSCLENLENYLFTCYDAIALLLMIRLTLIQQDIMEKRKIPCLDSYFNRVKMLLWPRFKTVFDMNIASIRNAKPKRLGPADLHPHYVIRRYAEFTASIVSLSNLDTNSKQNEKSMNSNIQGASLNPLQTDSNYGIVVNSLVVLRDEVSALLYRLADEHNSSKDKCVFLINNYDFILNIIYEKRLTCEETVKFEELLSQQRELFVEEELMTSYGKLILFVREHEHNFASGQTPSPNTTQDMSQVTSEIESIVTEFARTWKRGIEEMNSDVMKYFSNFRNGMEILKLVLTQLLLYYTRFIDVMKKTLSLNGGQSQYRANIVTTQEILHEIKKYSRSF